MADKIGAKLKAQMALGPGGIARQFGRETSESRGGRETGPVSGDRETIASLKRRNAVLATEVGALQGEVARLKRELAERPAGAEPDSEKPWIKAGVSKATWYRRQRDLTT